MPNVRARRMIAVATAAVALLLTPAAASAFTPPPDSPPGANDPNCRPTAEHPYPVVLVHGTFANQATFVTASPLIKSAGYCVFALDYGRNATADIRDSARELDAFVNEVLALTGASKVSLVGHSQGGMMPRYWMKFLGGASKVDDLIGLAPSNHGTTNPLAPYGARWGCTACSQQAAGSSFMTELNSGGDTLAGPSYTVVSTRYDQVVTPYTSQALSGPADQVTNVVVQDRCPIDITEHALIIGDPVAIEWAINALGRPGPADPSFRTTCERSLSGG